LLFFAANYQHRDLVFTEIESRCRFSERKNTKTQLSPLFFHCEGGNFTALFDEICMAAMIPQG
jgi:hypothetical protein